MLARVIGAWDLHPLRWMEEWFPDLIYRIVLEGDVLVVIPDVAIKRFLPIWAWDLRTDRVLAIGSFYRPENVHLLHVDTDKNVLVTLETDCDINPP